jgi:5,10-methylenetetrahydromethanopterin reductase
MTGIKIGIRIPPCRPVPEVADAVRRAELAGFDSVAMPESPMLWRDTVAALVASAMVTDRITLATNVVSFATRSPSATASFARTISELAPGRFRLGIGAGDSAVTLTGRERTGTADLRRGIGMVRDLLAGRSVRVGDTDVELHDPNGPVPIYLAAEGPRNLTLAGEIADGVMTTNHDIINKHRRLVAAAHAAGRAHPPRHAVGAIMRISDDVERDARRLKPLIVRRAQVVGTAQLDAAGVRLKVPAGHIRLPDGTDLGHPRDIEAAIEFASQWIDDATAVWFARNVFMFGSAAELAARVQALALAGVDEVIVTNGSSFELPHELIERVGDELLPLPPEANSVYS